MPLADVFSLLVLGQGKSGLDVARWALAHPERVSATTVYGGGSSEPNDATRALEAQGACAADTVLVGFWCDKGACTPSVAALLSALHGKRVFLFGTCGFGADQSYYQQIIDRVTSNLAGDAELAGWAMCQGKMGPAVKQRYEAMLEQDPENARFKMLLDNWVAAKDHPTKEDLDNMAAAAKKAVLGE